MMDPEFLDERFDAQFKSVKNLTWYPWVGRDYVSAPQKLLVVGESFRVKEADEEKQAKQVAENCQDTLLVRECLYETQVDKSWNARMYTNLFETLCDRGCVKENSDMLRRIAYYNFIQRPMDYRYRERPEDEDYQAAWPVFLDVIKILRPSVCLFTGVSMERYLDYCMRQQGIKSVLECLEEDMVGDIEPRRATLTFASGESLRLYFIQHPSSFFSPQAWFDFLNKHMSDTMNWLNGLA